VPLLLGGPHAAEAAPALEALGFAPKVASDRLGVRSLTGVSIVLVIWGGGDLGGCWVVYGGRLAGRGTGCGRLGGEVGGGGGGEGGGRGVFFFFCFFFFFFLKKNKKLIINKKKKETLITNKTPHPTAPHSKPHHHPSTTPHTPPPFPTPTPPPTPSPHPNPPPPNRCHEGRPPSHVSSSELSSHHPSASVIHGQLRPDIVTQMGLGPQS
jgi:hypothetical protein